MIGIYVSEKSRTIVMESEENSRRKILTYTGDLDLTPEPGEQPNIWDFEEDSMETWERKTAGFRELCSLAGKSIVYRVTPAELKKFKTALNPSKREPSSDNLFDQAIYKAGKSIGRDICLTVYDEQEIVRIFGM